MSLASLSSLTITTSRGEAEKQTDAIENNNSLAGYGLGVVSNRLINDWQCFTARCICISAVYAVTRCLSVRASVTFVSCAKTNKNIFEIFSPSGSHTILVFPYQTGWRCSDGNPPNGGVECKGYEKMTTFDQYLALSEKRL